MRKRTLLVVAALALGVCFAVPLAARAGDEGNPHQMTKPNGTADPEKCGFCHNDDLTLARSKVETCTMCHSDTPHAGAYEHLHASPAAVARLLPPKKDEGDAWPLTDEGGIYCGTCHVFHDPVIMGEALQPMPRPRSTSDFAQAVRQGREAQWNQIAKKYDQPSAGRSQPPRERCDSCSPTDGALCLHCHRDKQ